MMKKTRILWIVPIVLLLAGCQEITLESRNKSESLTYKCGIFISQAESGADRQILLHNMEKLTRHASRNNRLHDIQEMDKAADADDWERLEKLVVKYACRHGVS